MNESPHAVIDPELDLVLDRVVDVPHGSGGTRYVARARQRAHLTHV